MSVEEPDPVAGRDGRAVRLPPIAYPILAVLFGGALVWSFSRILLAVSDYTIEIGSVHIEGKAATAAIALLMALNVLIGAALVAYGGRVRRRPASYPLLLGAGVILIAGGITATTLGAPPAEAKVQTVNLVAQGTAFQQKTLTFATGRPPPASRSRSSSTTRTRACSTTSFCSTGRTRTHRRCSPGR